MNLYGLVIPQKWEAGRARGEILYFPCADCGAHSPDIAGFLAASPAFKDIAVLPRGDGKGPGALAMFCRECFDRREKEDKGKV
jgi:hypothetical protein